MITSRYVCDFLLISEYFLCFPGSMGGSGSSGVSGGAGGGILFLNISNNLIINGDLMSNGMTGATTGSGGGSGGSILIEAATFHGTGTVQV